ncbi:hypothetical protein CDAR_208161 [Caerostris darwini]|uniref:Uncharacterized protein n=1 Tax=Caerostris darwini TaxID=1538125 RepID=A0AAV4RGH8_9ARAC|nr:hypothetical protein CDAR_208161 [Caerostris darwini]
MTDTSPLYGYPFLLCTLVSHPFPSEREEGKKNRNEILHVLLPLNLPLRAARIQILISGRDKYPPSLSRIVWDQDITAYIFPRGGWGKDTAYIKSSWDLSACLSSSLVLPIQFSCFPVPSSFTFTFTF